MIHSYTLQRENTWTNCVRMNKSLCSVRLHPFKTGDSYKCFQVQKDADKSYQNVIGTLNDMLRHVGDSFGLFCTHQQKNRTYCKNTRCQASEYWHISFPLCHRHKCPHFPCEKESYIPWSNVKLWLGGTKAAGSLLHYTMTEWLQATWNRNPEIRNQGSDFQPELCSLNTAHGFFFNLRG